MTENVVSINKFKEREFDLEELNKEEVLKEMIDAILESDPSTLVVMGIAGDGEGMLAHTPMASRFAVIGALESIKQWLFSNGLDTGEID